MAWLCYPCDHQSGSEVVQPPQNCDMAVLPSWQVFPGSYIAIDHIIIMWLDGKSLYQSSRNVAHDDIHTQSL